MKPNNVLFLLLSFLILPSFHSDAAPASDTWQKQERERYLRQQRRKQYYQDGLHFKLAQPEEPESKKTVVPDPTPFSAITNRPYHLYIETVKTFDESSDEQETESRAQEAGQKDT